MDEGLPWKMGLVLTRGLSLTRDNVVDLVGSYQFDDQETEGGDVFARDPYILRFRCLDTGERVVVMLVHPPGAAVEMFLASAPVLKDLVLIPVHTKPDDSEKELDELYDVFLNVTKKWATDVRRRLPQKNRQTLCYTERGPDCVSL